MFLSLHLKKIWNSGGIITTDPFLEHYNKNKHVLEELSNKNVDINLNGMRIIKKSIKNLNDITDPISNVLINCTEETKTAANQIESQYLVTLRLSDNQEKMKSLKNTLLNNIDINDPQAYTHLAQIGKNNYNYDNNILNSIDFSEHYTIIADTYSVSSLFKIMNLANTNETLSLLIFEPRICYAIGIAAFITNLYYPFSNTPGNFNIFINCAYNKALNSKTSIYHRIIKITYDYKYTILGILLTSGGVYYNNLLLPFFNLPKKDIHLMTKYNLNGIGQKELQNVSYTANSYIYQIFSIIAAANTAAFEGFFHSNIEKVETIINKIK